MVREVFFRGGVVQNAVVGETYQIVGMFKAQGKCRCIAAC